MTPDETRALNRSVHLDVLNLCPHDETKYVYFDNDERERECVKCGDDRTWIPPYSTSIEHAWPLVGKFWMTVACLGDDGWSAAPSRRSVGLPTGDRTNISAQGATAPQAICLAAIKAETIRKANYPGEGGGT